MKYLHKYGTRRNEIQRAKRELYLRLGLAVAALLFFTLMFLITRFRPRLEETGRPEQATVGYLEASSAASLDSLRQQANAIFKDYHDRIATGMDPMDGIQLLDNAIQLQNEIIGSRTSSIAPLADVERLRELQKIKHETMGNYLIAQSKRHENQARETYEGGNIDEAIRLMRRAMNIQNQINQQYSRSSNSNASRVQQLSRELLEWQARPIADKADALKKEAYELAAAGRYEEARRKIRAALNEQKALATEFRQSRYATQLRMRSFESAILEINTAEDAKKVVELVTGIEQSLDAGDSQSALANAEQAELLQKGILAQFTDPPDQQTELLVKIQVLKDTAASLPAFNRIQSLRMKTIKSLRGQDLATFQTQVAEWSREATVFSRRFKQSRLLGGLDLEEIEFLHDIRGEVPAIMDMVYNNLGPVPGSGNLMLYKMEVSQALYESVTGQNPSTTKDPLMPVDSVTWEEAVEFTGKLGRVLARTVALPDQATFLAAVGETNLQSVGSTTWASENSSRQVQQCGKLSPGKNGFHDLLGNVSEWLYADSSDNPGEVMAIGGSARDSSARLASIPEDLRAPDERNRFIGFRFVIANEIVPE